MRSSTARRHDPSRSGLLDQVVRTTGDEEYARAAERRGHHPRSRGALACVVLVVFGLMLGVSAARTARTAPQAAQQRAALVDEIHQQRRLLDDQQRQISALRDRNAALQDGLGDDVSRSNRTSARVDELAFNAGSMPITGPGLTVVADGGPASQGQDGDVQDTDLQMLVNGLWEAGAEGIAINGHRLGPSSAIRTAGFAITVNYVSLTEPYVVEAVGDPATLQARLLETQGGQLWTSLRTNFGFRFDVRVTDTMTLVGNAHEHLLHAKGDR